MTHIYNKSSHPVAVKRIPVRIWTLRDEIEAAVDQRIKECEAGGVPLFLDDIKEYYGMRTDKPMVGQPQLQLVQPEAGPNSNESSAEASSDNNALVQKADDLVAQQMSEEKKADPEIGKPRPYVRARPDSPKISYGFALLADINMDWMLTFSKDKFIQGQSIIVEFLIPQPFTMSADVLLCHNYAMRSRIISESKPDYRVQCRFTFTLPGERSRLREFLTSIEPALPKKNSPKAPAPTSEGTGPEA